MAKTITTVGPSRVVRRLVIELDDTGTFTIKGDVHLGAMFNIESPWLIRLAEDAQNRGALKAKQETAGEALK